MDKQAPPGRALRTGFSTGTAAAAAAKAALLELLGLPCPPVLDIRLPVGGTTLAVPLLSHGGLGTRGEALVVKDGGDDPDVTHGARIGARVGWANGTGTGEVINFTGGQGVGRVTKPGLPVAVGEPAINPVPRRMLRRALREVWESAGRSKPLRVSVEIFAPQGEELARHTLNPRLGILGGISILGTTGLVRPYSHAAWRATIAASLKVARAQGRREVVFTTGGKSEAAMRHLFPHLPAECFVLMGDYLRFSLKAAANLGFTGVTVAAFFGKAVKMAQGFRQTHASRGLADLKELGRWVRSAGGPDDLAQAVAQANTARHALELLQASRAEVVVAEAGRRLLAALRAHLDAGSRLTAVILDFSGLPLWQGEG
jgi:cobalt-precorrin-5B (C1)-methyltransferase